MVSVMDALLSLMMTVLLASLQPSLWVMLLAPVEQISQSAILMEPQNGLSVTQAVLLAPVWLLRIANLVILVSTSILIQVNACRQQLDTSLIPLITHWSPVFKSHKAVWSALESQPMNVPAAMLLFNGISTAQATVLTVLCLSWSTQMEIVKSAPFLVSNILNLAAKK